MNYLKSQGKIDIDDVDLLVSDAVTFINQARTPMQIGADALVLKFSEKFPLTKRLKSVKKLEIDFPEKIKDMVEKRTIYWSLFQENSKNDGREMLRQELVIYTKEETLSNKRTIAFQIFSLTSYLIVLNSMSLSEGSSTIYYVCSFITLGTILYCASKIRKDYAMLRRWDRYWSSVESETEKSVPRNAEFVLSLLLPIEGRQEILRQHREDHRITSESQQGNKRADAIYRFDVLMKAIATVWSARTTLVRFGLADWLIQHGLPWLGKFISPH